MSNPLAPRFWGGHLLALVLVSIAAGLGLWQYDAWQAHRAAEALDLTEADPMPLVEVMGNDDPFPGNRVGQPVSIAGTWVPGGTVYISGREHSDRDGFWMVTPLAVGDADAPAVPVVLGWLPDADAAPPAPTGTSELVAWLQPTEGTGEVDPDPHDDVIPQVRTADLIQHVDQDLYGAYAVAQEPVGPLEAVTPEQLPQVSATTGLKNFLYAIEWWVFALFAGFIWWRWVRDITWGRVAAREPEPALERTG